MAGDLFLRESAVVVGGAQADSFSATTSMAAQDAGVHVLHRYGPRVAILVVPEGGEDAVQSRLHEGAELAFSDGDLTRASEGLDETGTFGIEALQLRGSAEYGAAKTKRPLDGSRWDGGRAQPPDIHGDAALTTEERISAESAEAAPPSRPTSAQLMDRVAVGLIIVEGPTPDLQFSQDERTKVVAEVQNGLGWLGTQESSALITWSYDIHTVSLNVQANPNAPDLETHWRDPAMAALGFAASWNGVGDYVRSIRTNLAADWAYCAFFTKYPVGHFAYASIGGPRVVMAYDNDGWGPDNIDRVFAHETGHIFGAPDEYASSGCNCGGPWGFNQGLNSNCHNCAPGGGTPCIMKSNDWAICGTTPSHFGWDRHLPVQSHWSWCKKCQGLAFSGGAPGKCPAGGVHDHSGSGRYRLLHNTPLAVQAAWRWCKKCQALAFAGVGAGQCPAGGNHDHSGSGHYSLLHSVPGPVGQAQWRWCKKCQVLAFAGGSPGPCNAGGTHDHVGSGNYTILHNVSVAGAQAQWRWCKKCQGLAYGGGGAGVCRAGGSHDHAGSGNYSLLHNVASPTAQANWRWCKKCQGLAFGGGTGPCPGGGKHDHAGSGNYTLLHGLGIDQPDWKWCKKCQGLAFSGAGAGKCPAGGSHDHAGSGNYSILHVG